MASRDVKVAIIGDASSLKRALAESESATSRLSDGMKRAGDRMTVGLTVPLVAGFAKAIDVASDLNEVVSKSNSTFGEAADQVNRWAEDSAEGFGQSRREALEAASTFGNLFTQIGIGTGEAAGLSTQMVELASDFASFHNADISDVLDAQAAAFRGEYDAVQRFVPTLNAAAVEQKAMELGLADTTAELDAQDKVLATHKLMIEGAGTATGDFDRTSDSLANQQRILRAQLEDTVAELGTKLLPIAQDVVGGVASLVEKFDSLTDTQQNVVLWGAGIVAAIGPVMSIAGRVSKAVGGVTDAVKKLGVGGTAGVGVGIAGLAVLGDALVTANQQADDLAASLTENMQPGLEGLRATLARVTTELEGQREEWHEYDGVGGILRGTIEVLSPLENKVLDNAAAVRELTDAAADLQLKATHLDENLLILQNTLGLSEAEASTLADRIGVDLTRSFSEVIPQITEAYEQAQDGTVQSENLAEATETLTSKVSTATDKVDALSDSFRTLIGVNLSAEEANIRLQGQMDTLTQKFKDNGTTLDLTTEKGRENRQALVDVAEAAIASAEAYGRQTGDLQGASDQLLWHTEQLKNEMRQAGLTEDQINYLTAAYGLVPKNIRTAVSADTAAAQKAVDDLRWSMDQLPAQKRVEIIVTETRHDSFRFENQASLNQQARAR